MAEEENLENHGKEFDPGWNDPPMFSYDSRQQYNNVKKPSLTKRVGLSWGAVAPPLQSPESQACDVLPASAPPRGIPSGPPPAFGSPPVCDPKLTPVSQIAQPSISSQVSVESSETNSSVEISVDAVSTALKELAEKLFKEREREKTELNKRILVMVTQWRENKFPNDVQEKLSKLSEALKIGNVDEADQLQRGLMVDHSTLCCSWMSAIRKMIAESRLASNTA